MVVSLNKNIMFLMVLFLFWVAVFSSYKCLAAEVDPSLKKAITILGSNDRSSIESEIGGIGGCAAFGDQECQDILVKLWHREDIYGAKINYKLVDKDRARIAGFMISLGGKLRKEAIQYLYAMTKSPNTGERADAYFRLYNIGDRKAVNELENAVLTDVPIVSHEALEALNLIAKSDKTGAKDARQFLSNRIKNVEIALRSSDVDVVRGAVDSLRSFSQQDSLPLLNKLWMNPSMLNLGAKDRRLIRIEVASVLLHALKVNGNPPAALERFIYGALSTPDPHAKTVAILALIDIGNDKAIDTLKEIVLTNPGFAKTAILALGMIAISYPTDYPLNVMGKLAQRLKIIRPDNYEQLIMTIDKVKEERASR